MSSMDGSFFVERAKLLPHDGGDGKRKPNESHTYKLYMVVDFFSSFSLTLSVFANVMKTMLATFLDDILCRAPEKCKNITIITSYTKKNPYISTSSPFRRPALSTLLSDCHCKDVEIKQKS